ncbi:hypothetical protein, partial [Paenibacillus sp. cl123]
MQRHFSLSLSCMIGEPQPTNELHQSFSSATSLAEYRIFAGKQSTITSPEWSQQKMELTTVDERQIADLAEALHAAAPASVTVTVRNAYGESLGDIPVTLSRPESGELVSYGRTSAAGILTLPAGYEGETIRVEAKLGRPYLASEPYLLKLSRQTETVIEAKVPTGIVYGVVKNGDQPVTNVRVTVSQPQMT